MIKEIFELNNMTYRLCTDTRKIEVLRDDMRFGEGSIIQFLLSLHPKLKWTVIGRHNTYTIPDDYLVEYTLRRIPTSYFKYAQIERELKSLSCTPLIAFDEEFMYVFMYCKNVNELRMYSSWHFSVEERKPGNEQGTSSISDPNVFIENFNEGYLIKIQKRKFEPVALYTAIYTLLSSRFLYVMTDEIETLIELSTYSIINYLHIKGQYKLNVGIHEL